MSAKKEPQIIYEDSDLLALNKPSGMLVHSDGRSGEFTLTDWVIENRPDISNVGEPQRLIGGIEAERPGIVHRLDKETSGVIVIAKNQKAFVHIKRQFQEREVTKIYNAFVYGVPRESSGAINFSIGRSVGDFRIFSVERGVRGKMRDAETEYNVLDANQKFSFVDARPRTGRTHQIRVHFKAIGHPIVCDGRYAPKLECALGFKRLALHARSISLISLSGLRLILEAPLPHDFENALKILKRPLRVL